MGGTRAHWDRYLEIYIYICIKFHLGVSHRVGSQGCSQQPVPHLALEYLCPEDMAQTESFPVAHLLAQILFLFLL